MITVRADMPTMAGNITMTCEPIYEEGVETVSFGSSIDPAWQYTDPAGHHFELRGFHASVHDTEYYCVDCEDMHGDGNWLCNLCEAPIKPKMISGSQICSYRTPDRLLGIKTTLTYFEETDCAHQERTWVFENDELTQKILDAGCITPDVLEVLESMPTEKETYYSW